MKKIYLVFIVLCFSVSRTEAQYIDINYEFAQVLEDMFPGCTDGSINLDTTFPAIVNCQVLNIAGRFANNPMANLGGIQYFDNLRKLDCSYNALDNLGPLPASLDTLYCSNQLWDGLFHWTTLLDVSNLPAGLKYLDCSNNGIYSITSLPAALEWLDCSGNYFHTSTGAIIPSLGSIDALPPGLRYLKADGNLLTSLPQLPATLQYLSARDNAFYWDDGIFIYNNLGISCIPTLPASMQQLYISGNNVTCKPNSVPGMSSDMTLPICNATNDPNYCYRPIIYATPVTLTGLAATLGSASPSKTYNVSGANLQPASGNITITSAAPLELSVDNINFSSVPLTVAYTAGNLPATPIYVRIASNASGGGVSGTITNSGGTASDVIVSISGSVARMYYNTKADLGLTNPGTWSSTVDGSGSSPTSLTGGGLILNIIDQTKAHYTGIWDASASNTRIVIGDAATSINFTIPVNDYITSGSMVDVMNNSTLQILSKTTPKINFLAEGSTVDFAFAGTGVFDEITIPTTSYYNLKLTNGIKSMGYPSTTVRNNFVVDAVSKFNGGSDPCVINCFGNVSFINGTVFRPDSDFPAGFRRIVLKMNGPGPVQNITSDGTVLRLLSIERDSTSVNNIIVSPGTEMEFTSDDGGGIFFHQPNATLSTTGGKITMADYVVGFDFNESSAMNSNGTSFYIFNDNYGYKYGSTWVQEASGLLRFTPLSTIKNLSLNMPANYDDEDHIVLASDVVVTDSLILTKGRIVLNPGVTLDIAATAIVAGGNRNSFVDGALKRTGNANLLFPVGNGFRKYRPLYMGFLPGNSGGTYTTQYNWSGYGNYIVDPATLALYPDYDVSRTEYWTITPAAAGVVDSLTFSYTDTFNHIIMPAALRIAHFDNTDWNDLGGTAGVANTTSGGSVTVLNISAFSPFTFAGTTVGVVPVKLTSFSVKKQNTSVQLSWTTEQEINTKTFVVERSLNGNKWDEITRLNAAGNSSQKINYTTTDFNPAKGVNYYRLKQIDVDGKFNYSEIRSVYFGNDVNIVLVPNPAVDKVTVYLPGNTTITSIEIYNINGQLTKTIQTTNESVQINLSDLSKGMYTLKINGKHLNEVRKLLVQ